MSTQAPSPTPPQKSVRLTEEEVQAVLLVRAFEEADSDGTLLSRSERQQAARTAQATSFERFLVQRARPLVEALERELAILPRLRRAVRLRVSLIWIVLAALVLGLVSNLLGPEKRINVIANPLAGLIVWNLAIYVLILAGSLLRFAPSSSSKWNVQPALSLATRLASWPARAAGREMAGSKPSGIATLASGTGRFLETWNRTARVLLSARVRSALHCGAAVAVVGAIGGMYVRGMLFEYRASWESTFLTADQVQALLATLLAPAAAISGIALPDVAEIGGGQAGDAAAWIHLYALTTVLLVIVPRTLLSISSALRARSLRSSLELPIDASYYRRLQSQGGGGEVRVRILPYSYGLSAPRGDRLKSLLHDVLGARARITIEPPLTYGEMPAGFEELGSGPASHGWRILLFNLSQTPESEVHGELVEKLKRSTERGGHMVVLADASAWRERAGQSPAFEQRLAEHRRTWDRVVRDAGLRAVHLDLDQVPSDDLVSEVEAGVYPPQLAKDTAKIGS